MRYSLKLLLIVSFFVTIFSFCTPAFATVQHYTRDFTWHEKYINAGGDIEETLYPNNKNWSLYNDNEIGLFDSGPAVITISNKDSGTCKMSIKFYPNTESYVVNTSIEGYSSKTFNVTIPDNCEKIKLRLFIDGGDYDVTTKIYHTKTGSAKKLAYSIYSVNAEAKLTTVNDINMVDLTFRAPDYPTSLKPDGFKVYASDGVDTREITDSSLVSQGANWITLRDTNAQPGKVYNYSYKRRLSVYFPNMDEHTYSSYVDTKFVETHKIAIPYYSRLSEELEQKITGSYNILNNSTKGMYKTYDIANSAKNAANSAYNKANSNYGILSNSSKGLYKTYEKAEAARAQAATAKTEAVNAKNAANTASSRVWDSSEGKSAATLSKEARDKANSANNNTSYIRNTQLPDINTKIANLDTKITNVENTILSNDTTPPDIKKVEGLNGATCTTSSNFTLTISASDNGPASNLRYKTGNGSWGTSNNVTVTPSKTGANTVTVYVSDNPTSPDAGNISHTSFTYFKI